MTISVVHHPNAASSDLIISEPSGGRVVIRLAPHQADLLHDEFALLIGLLRGLVEVLARRQHELRHLRPIHVDRQEVRAAIDQIHASIRSEDLNTKRSAIKRTIARVEAGKARPATVAGKSGPGEYFAYITPNLDHILGGYDAIRRSQYHPDSLTFKIDLTEFVST